MSKKRILLITTLVVIIAATVWNYPMTYRIGVDGKVYEKKIPFYAKACGFLYRDWAYKDLVREIIGREKDETKKALAILSWVDKNIMRGIPAGLKVLDDHPLNIIIRQYGAEDQTEDVFTILCSYAGMQADWGKCYNSDRSSFLILSFIKINGRWLVFDASRDKYFVNRQGAIAGIEDCVTGNLVLSGQDAATYKRYLDNIREAIRAGSTRPYEQMPLRRVAIEIDKLLGKKQD